MRSALARHRALACPACFSRPSPCATATAPWPRPPWRTRRPLAPEPLALQREASRAVGAGGRCEPRRRRAAPACSRRRVRRSQALGAEPPAARRRRAVAACPARGAAGGRRRSSPRRPSPRSSSSPIGSCSTAWERACAARPPLGLSFQGSYAQTKVAEPAVGGHASAMGPAPDAGPRLRTIARRRRHRWSSSRCRASPRGATAAGRRRTTSSSREAAASPFSTTTATACSTSTW